MGRPLDAHLVGLSRLFFILELMFQGCEDLNPRFVGTVRVDGEQRLTDILNGEAEDRKILKSKELVALCWVASIGASLHKIGFLVIHLGEIRETDRNA